MTLLTDNCNVPKIDIKQVNELLHSRNSALKTCVCIISDNIDLQKHRLRADMSKCLYKTSKSMKDRVDIGNWNWQCLVVAIQLVCCLNAVILIKILFCDRRLQAAAVISERHVEYINAKYFWNNYVVKNRPNRCDPLTKTFNGRN